MKINYVNVDNIVVSKLIETKTNYKYLIVYLDEVRRFVLILPKWVDILKLLALKMEAKIGRFWNIKLNALSVDDIYIYIYIYEQNNNI